MAAAKGVRQVVRRLSLPSSIRLVSGTLPEDLTGPARINVKAYGPGQCLGTSGWLVKIRP